MFEYSERFASQFDSTLLFSIEEEKRDPATELTDQQKPGMSQTNLPGASVSVAEIATSTADV